ncbi:MAG: hypothetical protein ABI782_13140 [Anaerolineaceae bacterium]
MNLSRSSFLIALLTLAIGALITACGGDDNSDSSTKDSSTKDTGGSGASKQTANPSGGSIKIPAIKDGAFQDGVTNIEISGEKNLKIDGKGNGIVSSGFTLLTYVGSGGTAAQFAFQADTPDSPGGVTITGGEVVTGGQWGRECTVSLSDNPKELKGEFSCKNADALLNGTKSAKVNVKGTFTAQR